MPFRIAPVAFAGLAGLVGLNVWLVAMLMWGHVQESEVQSAAAAAGRPPSPAMSDAKPPASKPISAYPQTLARPVFFKSREPYVPPPPAPPPLPTPVATPPPAPVDPGLALGGVAIMDGTRKAYIFSKADTRGAWIAEGETILGWTVESIDATTARLQQAERSIELQLYPKL
jgi:hypothetical protein